MGKKGSTDAPPPDPNVSAAAAQARDISGQEWDWYKNTYMPQQMAQQQQVQGASNQILSDYLNNVLPTATTAYGNVAAEAQPVAQQALQQAQVQGATGNQIYQQWNQGYAPIYGQIAATAAAKGGQADQDYQAMMARGDVAQAYANQAGQNARYLAQYGLNPASGTAMALQRTTGLQQSAQEAAAQTAARQAAANLGWTYKTDAAQIGTGLLGAGQNAYQASQASGTSALNASSAPITAAQGLGQTYGQAISTAQAPIGTLGTIGQGVSTGAQGSSAGITQSSTPLTTQENIQATQAAAQAKESGSMMGSLLGAAGTIGGAVMGGPVGAAIGSAAGKLVSGATS